MVDEERVMRLAAAVNGDIQRLKDLSHAGDLTQLPDQLDAVKYRFITAIEGCVSIAHHILVTEGWAAPDSNADAVRTLASRGVMAADIAEPIAKAAGFRNVLVHQYGDVDDSVVVESLENLDDLDSFVRAILEWLSGEDAS